MTKTLQICLQVIQYVTWLLTWLEMLLYIKIDEVQKQFRPHKSLVWVTFPENNSTTTIYHIKSKHLQAIKYSTSHVL